MLLKNKWGNDEIKEENGNYLKTNYNENTALKTNKPMGVQQKQL